MFIYMYIACMRQREPWSGFSATAELHARFLYGGDFRKTLY